MMKKRQLILNDYRTAEDGLFTLSACKITKAAQEKTFVKVPGRFAPLDLSTVLTDGQPYYGNASLDAVLESSEGTRAERQERIEHLKNLLDGQIAKIVHPDFPGRYMVGRVEVTPDFNGLAYCSVALSAVLEPWLYNDEETEAVTSLPHYEPYENLIPFPYSDTSKTMNGITFTVNADGSITVNGTATAQAEFVLFGETSAFIGQKLHLSGNNSEGRLAFINYTGPNAYDMGDGVTLDIEGNIAVWYFVMAGVTVNNKTIYPMLNEGKEAAPFKTAKNLIDVSPVTLTGPSYILKGQALTPELKAGTYTFSFRAKDYTPANQFQCSIVNSNGTTLADSGGVFVNETCVFTFTIADEAVKFDLYTNSAIGGTFYNFMLHPGKAAAPYAPYVNAGGENLFRAELGGDGYRQSGYYDALEVIDANTIEAIPKAGQGSDFIRFSQKYPSGIYTLSHKSNSPRQMIWLYDANGNNISSQYNLSNGVVYVLYNEYYEGHYATVEKLNVTIPDSVAFWRYGVFFQPDGNNKVTVSEIQVSRGEGTPYEPTYPLGDERLLLTNEGRLAVAPVVEVEGDVTLTIGNTSRAMSTGSYLLPELYLTPGEHPVQCSGTGTAKITYREAVLAG